MAEQLAGLNTRESYNPVYIFERVAGTNDSGNKDVTKTIPENGVYLLEIGANSYASQITLYIKQGNTVLAMNTGSASTAHTFYVGTFQKGDQITFRFTGATNQQAYNRLLVMKIR